MQRLLPTCLKRRDGVEKEVRARLYEQFDSLDSQAQAAWNSTSLEPLRACARPDLRALRTATEQGAQHTNKASGSSPSALERRFRP